MVMEKLIAELEAATEGSRELDGRIWWLVDRASANRMYWNAATGKPQPLPNEIPDGLGKFAVQNLAPRYSDSLDAALTLVPEGWHIQMTGKQGSSGWGICLTSGQLREKIGLAPTPSLTLCIAALRARQATQ